ncbi:MAG: methylmalonyl-CoA mutase, partial [Caulobacter sp.]|nr:methylmalonyl-CoA mutase [Caulobacter sp.]
MTAFPTFAELDFDAIPLAQTPAPDGAAWETPEGVAVAPSYGPEDTRDLDFLSGYPGVAPFLRGPYPTMYVTNPWTVRQYAGFS